MALRFGNVDFIGTAPKRVQVMQVIYHGIAGTFRLFLSNVSGDAGCEDVQVTDLTEAIVEPGYPRDFAATIDISSVKGTGECTLSFRAFDIIHKTLTGIISFSVTKTPCAITEWSDWSTNECSCCQGDCVVECRWEVARDARCLRLYLLALQAREFRSDASDALSVKAMDAIASPRDSYLGVVSRGAASRSNDSGIGATGQGDVSTMSTCKKTRTVIGSSPSRTSNASFTSGIQA